MESSDFDRYYACHFSLSYTIALRLTCNSTDAQDIAQSVFCKVWASRSGQPSAGPGTAWLSIVTRNAAVDYLRVRNSRREVGAETIAQGQVESAEITCLRNIESAHVWRLLDRLDHDRRTLIQESFVRRWSHARIAGHRKIAIGTVKSRIRTSLGVMRRIMDGAPGLAS
jgi:RNA polymerase sigma factor (sigma-70 family)